VGERLKCNDTKQNETQHNDSHFPKLTLHYYYIICLVHIHILPEHYENNTLLNFLSTFFSLREKKDQHETTQHNTERY